MWRPELRRYLAALAGPPHPVEAFSDYALDRVQANRAIIVAPASARIGALINRLAPSLIRRRTRTALLEELGNRPPS